MITITNSETGRSVELAATQAETFALALAWERNRQYVEGRSATGDYMDMIYRNILPVLWPEMTKASDVNDHEEEA